MIAHKTGTGQANDGVSPATNDVGLLMAPDGGKVAVAVFLSNTRLSYTDQDRLIAALSRAVVDSYVPRDQAP